MGRKTVFQYRAENRRDSISDNWSLQQAIDWLSNRYDGYVDSIVLVVFPDSLQTLDKAKKISYYADLHPGCQFKYTIDRNRETKSSDLPPIPTVDIDDNTTIDRFDEISLPDNIFYSGPSDTPRYHSSILRRTIDRIKFNTADDLPKHLRNFVIGLVALLGMTSMLFSLCGNETTDEQSSSSGNVQNETKQEQVIEFDPVRTVRPYVVLEVAENYRNQRLEDELLDQLSVAEIKLLRNVYYAFYGYSFGPDWISGFFKTYLDGYEGVTTQDPNFTGTEWENIMQIRNYERSHGFDSYQF